MSEPLKVLKTYNETLKDSFLGSPIQSILEILSAVLNKLSVYF